MRNSVTTTCILLAAAVALVAGLAAPATAEQVEKPTPSFDRSGKYFTISSIFSGALKKEVSIRGTSVVITRETVLRGTQGDTLDYGSHVANRSVYVAGVVGKDGRLTATMVVVRDGRKHPSTDDVGELPDDAPR